MYLIIFPIIDVLLESPSKKPKLCRCHHRNRTAELNLYNWALLIYFPHILSLASTWMSAGREISGHPQRYLINYCPLEKLISSEPGRNVTQFPYLFPKKIYESVKLDRCYQISVSILPNHSHFFNTTFLGVGNLFKKLRRI